jgi:ribosomal protein S18 acetylase RimI-like enzyme
MNIGKLLTIRNATLADAENIAALGLCVWIDTYATEGVRTRLTKYALACFALANIQDVITSKTVLVAEQAEHIVGYAILFTAPERTEIHNLYVLPKFQRCGIGKRFIDFIIGTYPRPWLACWEENTKAIAFYRAQGFIADGEAFFELDGEQYRNILFTYGV